MTSKALTRPNPGALALTVDRSSLQPDSLEELELMADRYAKSQLFPGIKTPAQAFAVCGMGRELGLGVAQSMQMIVVIQPQSGPPKAALWSSAKLALVRRDGHKVWLSHDPRHPSTEDRTFAEWTARRAGEQSEVKVAFSLEDAEAMGLLSKWRSFKQVPTHMIVKRALSRLLDEHFGDVLFGVATAEEVQEDVAPLEGRIVDTKPTPDPLVEALQASVAPEAQHPAGPPEVAVDAVRSAVEAVKEAARAADAKARAREPVEDQKPTDVVSAEEGVEALAEAVGSRDLLADFEALRHQVEETLEGDVTALDEGWQACGLPDEVDAANVASALRKLKTLANKAGHIVKIWAANRILREMDHAETEADWSMTVATLKGKATEAERRAGEV